MNYYNLKYFSYFINIKNYFLIEKKIKKFYNKIKKQKKKKKKKLKNDINRPTNPRNEAKTKTIRNRNNNPQF